MRVRPSRHANKPALRLTAPEAARRRARVVALVKSLPGATATGDRHLSLEVRGRRFGWLLENHHGDGRLALHCRAAPGASRAAVEAAPDRFHIPAYLGHRGWVGLWLDLPGIDWAQVERVLTEAYRMSAPERLIIQLDARPRRGDKARGQSETRGRPVAQ